MLKFFYNGIKDSSGQLYKTWYSTGRLIGHVEGTITIYAKNYGRFSAEIEQHFAIENNTDSQTDYFDSDKIRVAPTHPLYRAVLEAVKKQEDRTSRSKAIMIVSEKSQTHADMKKTFYTDYAIAKAVNVKDGIVTTYKLPNDDRKHELAKGFQRVMVIGDDILQAAALKLYEKAEKDGPARFFSVDEAKSAILALVRLGL